MPHLQTQPNARLLNNIDGNICNVKIDRSVYSTISILSDLTYIKSEYISGLFLITYIELKSNPIYLDMYIDRYIRSKQLKLIKLLFSNSYSNPLELTEYEDLQDQYTELNIKELTEKSSNFDLNLHSNINPNHQDVVKVSHIAQSRQSNINNQLSVETEIIPDIQKDKLNNINSDPTPSLSNDKNRHYVKIPNSIFSLGLKPKVLEFYCLLAYIAYSDIHAKLSIRALVNYYKLLTKRSIDKDTVNSYLNTLINQGVVVRNCTSRVHLIVGIGCGVVNHYQHFKKNYYHAPRECYTPFYIGMYETGYKDQDSSNNLYSKSNHLENTTLQDTSISGSLAIELYMGSKPYNRFSIPYLSKLFSTSTSTIYKYIKQLILSGIITRTQELLNRPNKALFNKYQLQTIKDKSNNLNLAKLIYHPHYDYQYRSSKRIILNEYSLRVERQAQEYNFWQKTQINNNTHKCYRSTSPYRRYYAGRLGVLLKKYGVIINQKIIDMKLSYNYILNYILNLEQRCMLTSEHIQDRSRLNNKGTDISANSPFATKLQPHFSQFFKRSF